MDHTFRVRITVKELWLNIAGPSARNMSPYITVRSRTGQGETYGLERIRKYMW